VKLYDEAFLLNQIRMISGRKARGSDPIRSWRYFDRAIEQAAKENPRAVLDRKGSDESG